MATVGVKGIYPFTDVVTAAAVTVISKSVIHNVTRVILSQ